jgi:hypothetical protein
LEALAVLSNPDTKRLEPQEYEGRRIQKVEDGWLILNGQKYRDKVSDEMRKARNRKAQAAWRDRQRRKERPLPGESAAVRAEGNGDYAGADRIVTESLPAQCRESVLPEPLPDAGDNGAQDEQHAPCPDQEADAVQQGD